MAFVPEKNAAPASTVVFGPDAKKYADKIPGSVVFSSLADIKTGVTVGLTPGFDGVSGWTEIRDKVSAIGCDSTLL